METACALRDGKTEDRPCLRDLRLTCWVFARRWRRRLRRRRRTEQRSMDLNQLISLTFQLSIFATVFGFGLKVATKDVLYVIWQPALLTRSLFAMFVVMPAVAAAL